MESVNESVIIGLRLGKSFGSFITGERKLKF